MSNLPIDPYSLLDSHTNTSSDDAHRKPLDVIALLALPGPLRKTAMALLQHDRATATTIAAETGRTVEAEQEYLMELYEQGFVECEHQSQDTYFSI